MKHIIHKLEVVNLMPLLSPQQKLFYGACKLGPVLMLNIVTIATFWIYGNHFNLDPKLNGYGNAVGKVAIALSGFMFGYISDKMRPRESNFGRRKFFIWTGSPLLAFSFVMIFIPHLFIPVDSGSSSGVFIWLLVWNSLFNIFYGYLNVPYHSWMPEITTEDERVTVSVYQNSAMLVSNLIGSGFGFIIAGYLETTGGLTPTAGIALMVFAVIVAILEVFFFLPALFFIKERKVKYIKRNIVDEFKTVLKNKNYIYWVLGFSVLSSGVTLIAALVLDFIQKILEYEKTSQFAIFGGCMFASLVASFYFWSKLAKKIGKKWTLLISFLWLMPCLLLTTVVGKVPWIPAEIQGYIFGLCLGIGLSAGTLFPYAIIADLADDDERKSGQNRAGLYTGFKSIPVNIAQALGFVFAGLLSDSLSLRMLGPIGASIIFVSSLILVWGDYDPFFKKKKHLISKNQDIIEG